MLSETSEILRGIAVAAASALGVHGTIHDYKKDGRVTREGRLAIATIVALGILAIAIQARDYVTQADKDRLAREQLRRENGRQQQLLANTRAANRTLASSTESLRRLHIDVKMSSEQIQHEVTVAQQSFTKTLGELDAVTKHNLARLSRPVSVPFFSLRLRYDRADERFPDYFRFLRETIELTDMEEPGRTRLFYSPISMWSAEGDPVWVVPKGSTLFPQFDFPQFIKSPEYAALSETSLYVTFSTSPSEIPSIDSVAAIETHLTRHLGIVALAWGVRPDESYETEWRNGAFTTAPGGPDMWLEVNLDAKVITKNVRFAAVRVLSNDGLITSELDLIQPPDTLYLQLSDAGVGHMSLEELEPPIVDDFIVHLRPNYVDVIRIDSQSFRTYRRSTEFGGGYVHVAELPNRKRGK